MRNNVQFSHEQPPCIDVETIPFGKADIKREGGDITIVATGRMVHKALEAGETLWDLAREYNTTSTTIMELNNIDDPKRLQVGQVLLVPAGTE